MTCPNGCDLEEFGGTHQGPPDCDLEPSRPDHPGSLVTQSMEALARRMLNTVDPAQSGYAVRRQCVALVRQFIASGGVS